MRVVIDVCSAWSATTYQLPCNLDSLRASAIDEQTKDNFKPAEWGCIQGPENENGDPGPPDCGVITARQQAYLSQIIHDTTTLQYGLRGEVTAREVIVCYKRFLNWNQDLPKPVDDIHIENQPLPHVLSLQYVTQN